MEPAEPTTDPPARSPAHSPGPEAGARCLACDYLLDGLATPVCPECGRPFDPKDPATFLPQWFSSRSMYRRSRRWAAPPPLWQLALYILLLNVANGPSELRYGLTLLLGPPLACSWFMRKWAVGYWGDRRGNGPRMARLKWWAGPVAAVWLLASLQWGPWFSPTFVVSYPFLKAKAQAVLSTGQAENNRQFIGLLWTRRVAPVGHGVKLIDRGRGTSVLVYDPTGEECRSSHVVCGFGNWCWRQY